MSHVHTNHIVWEAGNIQIDKYNYRTMENTKVIIPYFHDWKFGH